MLLLLAIIVDLVSLLRECFDNNKQSVFCHRFIEHHVRNKYCSSLLILHINAL